MKPTISLRVPRRRPEDQMCGALMQLIEPLTARYPKLHMLYHIPNEGRRAPWMARKMGIKRGMPDYCLPVRAGKYCGLYMELKAPGKRPTKEQLERLVDLDAEGYYVFWTDKLQRAFDRLVAYVRLAYGEIDEL